MRRLVTAATLIATLVLAACGGGADSAQAPPTDPAPASAAPSTQAPPQSVAATPAPATAGGGWTAPSAAPVLQTSFEIPEQPNVVETLAFTPDGTKFASGDADGTVKLWDTKGTELATVDAHDEGVNDVQFSPDGSTIASGAADGTAKLWNADGTEKATLEAAEDAVSAIAFSPDSTTVATASWDNNVRLFSVADGSLVDKIEADSAVQAVAFSRDGRLLVLGGSNGFLELWNTSPLSRATAVEGEGAGINEFVFSLDGQKMYAATNESTVVVFSTADGSRLDTFEADPNFVQGVDLSPDGTILASGAANGSVRLFDPEAGDIHDEKRNFGGVDDVDFSPTEPLLVTTSSKAIVGYTLR